MPEKRVEHYPRPAGGWDSLKASLAALRAQGIVAQGMQTLRHANQPEGFDCPGCAWPDRNHHSSFEFCENGVKAVAAEATSHRATPAFFAQHTVEELARQDDYTLESHGRLTHPMRYDAASDTYQPIAWAEAFALIAGHLNALASPHEAIFYTSGRTSNEAAFLYQLFVREFGTNNLPDCSNMCHEPSGLGMREQIGVGKGTVTLDDFAQAEALFIFGQNPGTNHPRMLAELRDAARRGCRIVVFNPLRERGLERFADPKNPLDMLAGGETKLAALYLQPRIGGDLAVAMGLAKRVLEEGREDGDFIRAHTLDFDGFRAAVLATPWSAIEAAAGLSRAQIDEAAQVLMASRATICTWGMGITQHKHAVATIQMIVNLLLLTGNMGKPGAGACPVRGHSNVQGDRTMGIYEKPAPAFLDKLGAAFGFAPPREHGYDAVEAIRAMQYGKARVFFALGGNFAAATPDTEATWAALRRCALTVHVTTKLNRSHLVHGKEALILPCLGRTEIDRQAGGPQSVTVEDSMSMVHLSSGMNEPASAHLMSEPAIVAHLAAATLPASKTPWLWLVEDYDRIRDRIAEVIEGFADFNARVQQPGGFYLGNSARDRRWTTPQGRAMFMPHGLPAGDGMATPFRLMTIRSHDQYNTTVYGLDDRYRGVYGHRRVCFIHREDLAMLGLRAGQWVDITSQWHDGERRVSHFLLVEYDIPRGCLASYFPETNPLVPLDAFADRAGTPASKSIPVRLSLSARQ